MSRDHDTGETQLEGTRSIELGLEIRDEISHGAFGTVHRAWDRGLQREVALKTLRRDAPLSPRARQRFLTEARMLARMDHPNIVRIHAVDEVSGQLHIRMELVKGRTLKELVEKDGPLAAEEAARIGIDLCRALATIHAQGLIHMDLKPANVMRAEGGRIVLLDFGFARSDHPDPDAGDAIGGTPLFSAPEQLVGSGELTPAVDLYALGVLLYWLVTRSYPVEAQTLAQLRERVEHGEPRPITDVCATVPAEFDEIVGRCLARDPAMRPRSAGALERELRVFLGETVAARAPASGRRAWIVAAFVLIAAASVVGLALAAFMRDTRSLDVQAALFVMRDGTPKRVSEGDPVAVGDRLYLEVRSDEDFHLYVFNEDEADQSFTLFPLTWQGDKNPLLAGETYRLPRGGTAADPPYYVVSSAGGGEAFFVIASREPLDVAETLRRIVPEARQEQPGVVLAEVSPAQRADLVRSTRGVGTVTQAAAPAAADVGRLADFLAGAAPSLRRAGAFQQRMRLSSQ